MRMLVLAPVAGFMGMVTAFAHQQGKIMHLRDAPPDQQIKAITYCDGYVSSDHGDGNTGQVSRV